MSDSDSSDIDVSDLREMCELCAKPCPNLYGGSITHWETNDVIRYRALAESALKAYNESKLKSFKLLEVCKVNVVVTYYGVTFRAQEDGSKERPLFRGVVRAGGAKKVVFCEMKGDEEITLPANTDDDETTFPAVVDDAYGSSNGSYETDDYVSLKGSYKSDENRPSSLRKNVVGDGSEADSGGGVKHGWTTNSDVGMISTSFQECVGSKKKRRKAKHGWTTSSDVGMISTSFQECEGSKKKRRKANRRC